ncbi:1-phosphofructokinase family hexose kinase [Yoonia sp.]|uniref:1-phosphofructokinase family hexose kinase n=1 Tax=Yoonia sp. TaxID=2212373 RepID=UPI0025D46721|nr:1-phosphofructokinase family hexose kinase [Yoonia sp.]
MPAILTITLNPSIDFATSVAQVKAGPKLRCAEPRIDPGGGGVNVARAIAQLDGQSTALVAVGGPNGTALLALLAAEGIPTHPVPIKAETRQSFAVTDTGNNKQYRFVLPGPTLSPEETSSILDHAFAAVNPGDYVVLSGSQPGGVPIDFPAQLCRRLTPKTDRVILDTSGPVLAHVIAHPASGLHVLRIDQNEARDAAGNPLSTAHDSVVFARGLVARGVAQIIVTGRGAEGSIMVSEDQHIFCHAPKVPVVSKIGAGDAFVGALTLHMARGCSPEHALRWAVAAASATITTEGTALCTLSDVRRLLPECVTTVA